MWDCVISHFSHVWLYDSMDCSPPGSSVRGILQVRILAWVTISSTRVSSQPRDQTQISCFAGRFFTTELPGKPHSKLTHLEIKLRVFSPLSNWFPGIPDMAVSVTWGTSDRVAGLDEMGCWGSVHSPQSMQVSTPCSMNQLILLEGLPYQHAGFRPSASTESSVPALGWPSCSLGMCFLGRSGKPGMDWDARLSGMGGRRGVTYLLIH